MPTAKPVCCPNCQTEFVPEKAKRGRPPVIDQTLDNREKNRIYQRRYKNKQREKANQEMLDGVVVNPEA